MSLRNLILVLGDQLDAQSAVWEGFDHSQDAVWMAEVQEESTQVWTHKARIALFLSAMRHFREELKRRGIPVHYSSLDAPRNTQTFAKELKRAVREQKPKRLIVLEPGEWRVQDSLEQASQELGLPLDIRLDRHFLCSKEEFKSHAAGRKSLRMEFFYREMRQRMNVLMEKGKPVGGEWNLDKENRGSFGKGGPSMIPPPRSFRPDAITREVLALVERKFQKHPGRLDTFDWPVTRAQALEALEDFVEYRLPHFGRFEDAMWSGQPVLYHSRLSSSMNLKLVHPKEIVEAVETAYRKGRVDLPSAEGFIRQVIGWREYVRGVYWLSMPGYEDRNALSAKEKLPGFYWTGDTPMNCLRQAIGQTLDLGYAHHIQRLMVTGLFALLYGVDPREVHRWYLAVYADAVEWVELPNTLGMSQYGDGGVMASKPYVATGQYIKRMSNYCQDCAYDPTQSVGAKACPFTTLYWDFLSRHEKRLRSNVRMALQLKNLDRQTPAVRKAIKTQAEELKARLRAADEKAKK